MYFSKENGRNRVTKYSDLVSGQAQSLAEAPAPQVTTINQQFVGQPQQLQQQQQVYYQQPVQPVQQVQQVVQPVQQVQPMQQTQQTQNINYNNQIPSFVPNQNMNPNGGQ